MVIKKKSSMHIKREQLSQKEDLVFFQPKLELKKLHTVIVLVNLNRPIKKVENSELLKWTKRQLGTQMKID